MNFQPGDPILYRESRGHPWQPAKVLDYPMEVLVLEVGPIETCFVVALDCPGCQPEAPGWALIGPPF